MLATVIPMTATEFPELRQPIQVGTMALDHRIVVPPHGGGAGALLGTPAQFEQHCAHWLAKVEGGVQWIGGGPTFVRNPLPPGFEPTGIGARRARLLPSSGLRAAAGHVRRSGSTTPVASCRSRWSCRRACRWRRRSS